MNNPTGHAMNYAELSIDALNAEQRSLTRRFEDFKVDKLNLDLTRGKPASNQLDLSNELDGILNGQFLLQDGTDVRNYGGLLGIPEARALGGDFLGVPGAQIMVGGNSSLSLMFQYIAYMMEKFWLPELAALEQSGEQIKFLCPVPGYDRHFTICEHFNIKMIPIEMDDAGPDMDEIERHLALDPLIKGIWCVPKYSNPTGLSYAENVVKRMAGLALKAGQHFRIMWDNAYAVHHLSDTPDKLFNIMDAANTIKKNASDAVVMFASTSKVTFAGGGIAFLGLNESNLKAFQQYISASAIGPDKLNQLRHVRFLKDPETIKAHMKKHAALINPKFTATQKILKEELGDLGIANWTRPAGGYFISLDTLPGLAKEVVAMASEIGVKLTPAGATYPYGDDKRDSNIRLAPTYPSLEDLKKAVEVLAVCLRLATVKQLQTKTQA